MRRRGVLRQLLGLHRRGSAKRMLDSPEGPFDITNHAALTELAWVCRFPHPGHQEVWWSLLRQRAEDSRSSLPPLITLKVPWGSPASWSDAEDRQQLLPTRQKHGL